MLKGITGFLALDLYFNLVPVQLHNPYLQLAATIIFFPFAYFIANWAGLGGLKGIGIVFHGGWKKNLLMSFLIGFCFWMLMFMVQFFDGSLEYIGVKQPLDAIMPLLEVIVGYLLGSLINDLIVRGYVIKLLNGKIHIAWVFMISILIYALDDYWYAGFSLSNIIFSLILGLSLTYAFYKTGSIWADTGIHYGLNVAYGLLFGMVGNPGSGVFIVKETSSETFLSNNILYITSSMMFLFVLWAIRFYYQTNTKSLKMVPPKRIFMN